MTMLIAGFGDLGAAIASAAQHQAAWRDVPIVALRRSVPEVQSGFQPDTPQKTDQKTGQKPVQETARLPNVSWLKADLTDRSSLQNALASIAHVSDVVYCAAPNERSEAAYRATYLTGLQNLVYALRTKSTHDQPARFLFVSSTAVYDNQAQGIFDENSPTEPRGFNGKVLCQAEDWLLSNWPEATILRLSGIYGPSKQRLLQSIAQGTSSMPASDDYIANRIHLEDAARAVLHLLEGHHTGIYLGTDSNSLPLRTLYTKLAELLGAPVPSVAEASSMMGKKQLSNQKLLDTGFVLKWPDAVSGYEAIIAQRRNHAS